MDKIQHHSTTGCEAPVGIVPTDGKVNNVDVEPVPWKKVLLSLPFWLVPSSKLLRVLRSFLSGKRPGISWNFDFGMLSPLDSLI